MLHSERSRRDRLHSAQEVFFLRVLPTCATNCASSGRRSPLQSRPGHQTPWRARCDRRAAPSTPRNPRARGRGSCSSAGGSCWRARVAARPRHRRGCSSCAGCTPQPPRAPSKRTTSPSSCTSPSRAARACARRRRTRRSGRRPAATATATSSSTATARSTTRRAGLATRGTGRPGPPRALCCSTLRGAARCSSSPASARGTTPPTPACAPELVHLVAGAVAPHALPVALAARPLEPLVVAGPARAARRLVEGFERRANCG